VLVSGPTFPLVPRRRLIGLSFGAMHSARRGIGSDVAGSRPYRPGDDVDAIDWNASARLSSARGTEEFVVREHYAEEAPRVVVVCDRRPAMSHFSEPLPWLSKLEAMERAAALISDSAVAARSYVGYLDYADGEPYWRPPRTQRELASVEERRRFSAPEDGLARALRFLAGRREALPSGSFVFLLSDFLASPGQDAWLAALEQRWDLVPVVIQDPIWEASFPDIAGVVVPVADPQTARVIPVRLGRREALEQRSANERRRERLLATFRGLGLEPVLLSSADPGDILRSFLAWAEERAYWRGRGW
jgi:uncharacterized protein (DUF58 family)